MLDVLREREAYLRARIIAKQSVGWEWQYDAREQQALAWAIERLQVVPGDRSDRGIALTVATAPIERERQRFSAEAICPMSPGSIDLTG